MSTHLARSMYCTLERLIACLFAALGLWFSQSAAAAGENIGRQQQELVQAAGSTLWTKNGNHVPMCWHELLQFASKADSDAAKAFVVDTIRDGWIGLLNLTISWENCPASGTAKHVRVKLRIGDASNNGTTLDAGMGTLTTPADRVPPKDPAGLLMGFQANWNQSAATRAGFRALILHEFGHVLGFDHEQLRPDGPSNVMCYSNSVANAIKLGPPDPQSIMGWSYCGTALGVLTSHDVSAARSVYGRGKSSLVQLHNNGEMWTYTGSPCIAVGCFGWALLDRNPSTAAIAIGYDDRVYQRHNNGIVWMWDGYSRCNSDACPGWTTIDRNPSTQDVVASGSTLYQRHSNGKIWRFSGTPCTPDACPGWILIDRNASTKTIAASKGILYQQHVDGKIWRYDGRSRCTNDVCPGWTLIDQNPSTASISAGLSGLFQRHADGKIWKWDGGEQGRCVGNACPGWTLIDKNPNTANIVAGGRVLLQRHADGKVWTWDGRSRCTGDACPGWALIDRNPSTRDVVAAGKGYFQRHADGKIWQWDERSRCSANACPGWALLDKNPSTKTIMPVDTTF